LPTKLFAALTTGTVAPLLLAGPAAATPAKREHPIELAVLVENANASNSYVTRLPVRPGAVLKVQLRYKNWSHAVQDTTVRVAVPAGSTIHGTPAITNSLHPTGWGVATGLVIHQGKSFGRYAPEAPGYLTITVQVTRKGLHCGSNWTSIHGYVTAARVGTAASSARINIVRVCPTSTNTVTAPS
jgi:hypothetical protein